MQRPIRWTRRHPGDITDDTETDAATSAEQANARAQALERALDQERRDASALRLRLETVTRERDELGDAIENLLRAQALLETTAEPDHRLDLESDLSQRTDCQAATSHASIPDSEHCVSLVYSKKLEAAYKATALVFKRRVADHGNDLLAVTFRAWHRLSTWEAAVARRMAAALAAMINTARKEQRYVAIRALRLCFSRWSRSVRTREQHGELLSSMEWVDIAEDARCRAELEARFLIENSLQATEAEAAWRRVAEMEAKVAEMEFLLAAEETRRKALEKKAPRPEPPPFLCEADGTGLTATGAARPADAPTTPSTVPSTGADRTPSGPIPAASMEPRPRWQGAQMARRQGDPTCWLETGGSVPSEGPRPEADATWRQAIERGSSPPHPLGETVSWLTELLAEERRRSVVLREHLDAQSAGLRESLEDFRRRLASQEEVDMCLFERFLSNQRRGMAAS